jgi:c-di-GMP-binding flagellar brake protein YcgR
MASKRVLSATLPKPPATSIVSDGLEIRQLLTRACEGQTAASLKIRGSENVLRSKLIHSDPVRDGVQLSFTGTLTPESFMEELGKHESKECMILVYLQGRSIIGFNAEPSEVLKDRLIFKAPERLFKIQRRKDVRFQIPTGYEYTIEMESVEQKGVRISKRLLEISESGLSHREAGLFRVGLHIQRCVIQMNNQKIDVSLSICNQAPFDRGPKGAGHKIGAVFDSIKEDDRKYLAQFIYSHALHLFY